MKGFRTYVITKKTLIKFAVVILFIILMICIFLTKLLNRDTHIEAFSNTAEKILDAGVINDKKQNTAKEIADNILGFDADDPVSIISNSSAALELKETPQPPPQKTEEVIDFVPSTDEIKNAKELKINNATNYEVDINELCKYALPIKLELNEPEVLIVHTHTTECYNGNEMTGESERTTNEHYNMCHIGDIVAETLSQSGIKVIHDKSIHDYPSYQGAYTRALKTIEKNMEEHPQIKVVLDIHRDAYVYADGSKLRVAKEINGNPTAQVMLVLGTDSMGLTHNNWRDNLTFAAKIQNTAELMYPTLMRPLNLRRERFNTHITKGSLLLEIGSNGNSIEEAERAAEYIGKAIATVLIND